ncbi:hypothetical protein ESCO_001532 [Escovopsis weberi]|uniref:Uncharacterized protein n=1 Tax=Escovopsis weberi TaxID=150374 RepID=A0A0M8N376_ESCWE|nr:hypothetical protein ESCO_001532 [Escovopsis weberi]
MLPQALLVVVLAPLALACKCFATDQPAGELKGVTTIECCNKYHGKIINKGGDLDCFAYTIRNHLNDFWKCCHNYGGASDCFHIEEATELVGGQGGEEQEGKDSEA